MAFVYGIIIFSLMLLPATIWGQVQEWKEYADVGLTIHDWWADQKEECF